MSDPEILDIGTGSGAIAITLAKNISKAQVIATDISQEALETARQNSELNGTEIRFLMDDILNPSALTDDLHPDIIVSNPPYVRESEKRYMHRNVLDFEPPTALFVNDSDPLLFYRAVRDFSARSQKKGGIIFLEINEGLR